MIAKEVKMGVEWGYLKTLLDLYNDLLFQYSQYQMAKRKLAHANEIKLFSIKLKVFYYSVMNSFDKYLEKDAENGFKPKDYINIDQNSDLDELFKCLCNWSQEYGPFATLIEKNNPSDAFRNG